MEELQFLEEQKVDPGLLEGIREFREKYPVSEEVKNRVVKPPIPFYGKEILEMAIAALLQGENVLLSGLTWSRPNAFGTGCCKAGELKEIPGGLTGLGREAVAKLEDLGMYVDVSHLNNEGFADLLSCARKPFIASHSNAWAVHRNYRNLRDDQIRALAERGSVIGLNANRYIAGVSPEDKELALSRLCDHIGHLVEIAGPEHVGYGFDLCNGLDAAAPGGTHPFEQDDLLVHHG